MRFTCATVTVVALVFNYFKRMAATPNGNDCPQKNQILSYNRSSIWSGDQYFLVKNINISLGGEIIQLVSGEARTELLLPIPRKRLKNYA